MKNNTGCSAKEQPALFDGDLCDGIAAYRAQRLSFKHTIRMVEIKDSHCDVADFG